jgi:hypothetical protein
MMEPLAPARVSRLAAWQAVPVRPTVAGQRRISTGFPHVGACAAADEWTTEAETSSKRFTPVTWPIVSETLTADGLRDAADAAGQTPLRRRMPWSWRYEKSDGSPIDGPGLSNETWTTQADAESWVGENWRVLVEAGVDQVSLVEDSRVVYGPMSLHPPEG